MPSVYYKQTYGTSCDIQAIKQFEKFLDDSHHEIAYNLHEQLVDFHSEIDDEVQEKLNEYKVLIDELKSRIEELESEE
ncbi:hypothetical protein [Brevibacillus formosus]|uniref:hypothetical protein n=1 Tax=Brevibacillus formosus TaxID=54913 RepID=UPI003F1B17CD